MKIEFNKKVIKFGLYVSLAVLFIGIITLLISTINGANFEKNLKNILLAIFSFGYFIVLMLLLPGIAAFWVSLLLFNLGLALKQKIIYYSFAAPIIILLNILFVRFTILTILRSLKSQLGF